jgi:RNA polymerase sigma-70 factor, ECF subfamily
VLLGAFQRWPDKEEPSDAALMKRLLQKEPLALEILYDRYARPLYSLVLRVAQQAPAAEELVQDVFLQLWRNADRYQVSRGPVGPWLFTLARNRALDFLRLKSEKQRRLEGSFEEDPPIPAASRPAYEPEREIDQARRAERVRELMASLPPPQRRAIEMAFFDGLSHAEIAAALGEPLGTVKSWIRGGLLRLRESLEKG